MQISVLGTSSVGTVELPARRSNCWMSCQEELLWILLRFKWLYRNTCETSEMNCDDTVSFFPFRFRRCKRLKSTIWVSSIFPQADVFWFAFHWNHGARYWYAWKKIGGSWLRSWGCNVGPWKFQIWRPGLGGTRDSNCTSCYSKVFCLGPKLPQISKLVFTRYPV